MQSSFFGLVKWAVFRIFSDSGDFMDLSYLNYGLECHFIAISSLRIGEYSKEPVEILSKSP